MAQAISTPSHKTSGDVPTDAARKSIAFEVLCACCSDGTAEVEQALETLLSEDVPWEAVLDQASFHNVESLIARRLLSMREGLPAHVGGKLEQLIRINAQRSLKLTQELIRVVDCMESHGIVSIPFKGPVLAEVAYGDFAMRQYSDLDVLIAGDDYKAAENALREIGYEVSRAVRPEVERAWIRSGYERSFDGPLGKNLLELQWRVVPRFYAVDLEVSDLFKRTQSVLLAGRTFRTLATEDLLIALCVHAWKHAWMRLGWTCDIARVMRIRSVEYRTVRQRAEALGVVRIVAISLWLANRLLRSPVPSEFAEEAEAAGESEKIYGIVARSEDYPTESFAYFQLMMELRERWRDRVKFAWRLFMTPSIGEWEVVALPRFLFPLYRVVRVGRVAKRLFSGGNAATDVT